MKNLILTSILIFVGAFLVNAQDLESGKTLFKSNCAACHTVGKGKLTGPDLKGVSERVTYDWIKAFIKNSTALVEGGDAYAIKLYKEFNEIPMPAHPQLSDDDIANIVAYIDDESVVKVVESAVATTPEMNDGTMDIINDRAKSAIDMPVVKMVFWGSVVIVSVVLISLSLILVRLLK